MRLPFVAVLASAIFVAACASEADPPAGDKGDPTAASTNAPASPVTTAARPTNTAVAANNSTATSINVTSPVARGGNATARIGTAPNAKCTIAYTTPSGTRSEAAGLEAKTADTKGEVSWTWVIGPSTNPGNATIRVTCDGQSATATIVIS